MYRLLLPVLLLVGCSDGPPTTPETRPVENPNAGNTAIYDVDPDDPYEIGDGSFMDMEPGETLAAFSEFLVPGELKNGDGVFAVHYIIGRRKDTLGYVFSSDTVSIESITILSPDAVTQDGIRVGNSFSELEERIGKVKVLGSPIEARVYAYQPPFVYRLMMNASVGPVDPATIDPATPILSITIE